MMIYNEPTTAAEMLERYASIRRKLYAMPKPKPVKPAASYPNDMLLLHHDAHVAQWRRRIYGVTAEDIVRELAEEHGMPAARLRSKSRKKEVVLARHAAVVRIYMQMPKLSLSQVGRCCGVSHHSTVLHIVKKHGAWRADKQEEQEA